MYDAFNVFWIQFANIVLRSFAFVCISDIGYNFL